MKLEIVKMFVLILILQSNVEVILKFISTHKQNPLPYLIINQRLLFLCYALF